MIKRITLVGVMMIGVLIWVGVFSSQESEARATGLWWSLENDERREKIALPNEPIQVKYGVNFASSGEHKASPERYELSRQTGAKWNRFPIYWHEVEQSADKLDWSTYDPVVSKDTESGFLINAILHGVPTFYQSENAVPNTLFEPIFSDGTDIPGPGKQININNKWARYVHGAVERYKPYGTLATQRGWTNGAGIRQWEIWNEPDLPLFYNGTTREYARLLKVAHIAAHYSDPQTQIIFGGLSNFGENQSFYEDVLGIFMSDPMASAHNHFHEIVATHSYFYSWGSWYHVYRLKDTMVDNGILKPIWLNEHGAAVWDDYPGPIWDPESPLRATQEEVADYVIQSSAYALYAGASGLHYFQFSDGCGNQPPNTTFPAHNGQLCTAGGMLKSDPTIPCAGDAFGLYRNHSTDICFNQHPTSKGQARPSLTAYKLTAQYLQDIYPLERSKICSQDDESRISFYRENTNQRITVVWACRGEAVYASIPALDYGALAISPDGGQQYLSANEGQYNLTLPGATNDKPTIEQVRNPIGGRPYIIVERDLQKPIAEVTATDVANGIRVSWRGDDGAGGGIKNYTVKVSVDGGWPTTWLANTTETSGFWNGSYNSSISFIVTATDKGNNWSEPAETALGTSSRPTDSTGSRSNSQWPASTPAPAWTPAPTNTPWPTSSWNPVSPTSPAPTYAPPTSPPPTYAPPTSVPPTSPAPTYVPPTSAPPTFAPPTSIPPTFAPPTSMPPTSPPPTSIPPTSSPPTIQPPTPKPTPTPLPPPNND